MWKCVYVRSASHTTIIEANTHSDIARNLYGPAGHHHDYNVFTSTTIDHDAMSGTNNIVYRAKCIGYRRHVGDEWELMDESIVVHTTAWEALDELLRAMKGDLEDASSKSMTYCSS